MSIRDDILAAVRGEMPARVPWAITQDFLPRGRMERVLRDAGLGIVAQLPSTSPEIYQWGPSVEIAERMVIEEGRIRRRVTYRTPVGELTELKYSIYGSGMAGRVSDWKLEFMVKEPADYAILEFMFRDQIYSPNFDDIQQTIQEIGDDGVVIPKVAKVPFQLLWMEYTGVERLIFDLQDSPKPVHSLMETMIERDRKAWQVAAKMPAQIVHCSDNISADLVSPRFFKQYFIPYYKALAEVIDPAEKAIVIHMDGLLRSLKEQVNSLPEGMVIEALTPPPDCDLSVAEAREAWGDRPIWINFPSSLHTRSPYEVEEMTLTILRQVVPGHGFVFGITENMPADCWPESMVAIGKVLERYGKCPLRF